MFCLLCNSGSSGSCPTHIPRFYCSNRRPHSWTPQQNKPRNRRNSWNMTRRCRNNHHRIHNNKTGRCHARNSRCSTPNPKNTRYLQIFSWAGKHRNRRSKKSRIRWSRNRNPRSMLNQNDRRNERNIQHIRLMRSTKSRLT